MNRLFIDMDGVIVDESAISKPYSHRPMVAGALHAITELMDLGLDCWIASKPLGDNFWHYADKAAWVGLWLPQFRRKLILTWDKGLLGDEGDYLVDNRPEKCNCEKFLGALIKFESWEQVMRIFRHAEVSDATA